MTTSTPAVLVLADGRIFRGRSFGATGTTCGEAVFTTAMTGYQEILTNPSSHRQILVSAAPHVGNTGWNDEDSESRDGRIWADGLVIRDLTRRVSNWRATTSLQEVMAEQGIIGISGVDTRTLVRHLRKNGTQQAGIFAGEDAQRSDEELLATVKEHTQAEGQNLTADVTTAEPYTVEADGDFTVVAYDMGITTSTLRAFAQQGITTVVLPATASLDDAKSYNPDGIVVSSGPGDPATDTDTVGKIQALLKEDIPFLGLGYGSQLLGRALGVNTRKMTHGHHGTNIPVKNHQTDEIVISTQHHTFELDAEPGQTLDTDLGQAIISHSCLHDDSVEGIALSTGYAISVQYDVATPAGEPVLKQWVQLLTDHSPNNQNQN